ncbi:MAG: sugar O-acetyltransferase, partial [Candidatus Hydrogenedentales bacterium]
YRAVGEEIAADQLRTGELLHAYNTSKPQEAERRTALLRDLLGFAGEGVVVRPPFYCDYGYNIRLGAGTFLNFNCIFLDVVTIELGENCQVGPGVQIFAADHPRDPELRRQGYESGAPICIRHNVWIGAGALILPGVTIGDDVIVGAGSVVTRNVAAGTTVVGNPARALARKR